MLDFILITLCITNGLSLVSVIILFKEIENIYRKLNRERKY
nr:MAG TPA: hypothetical protein [Caudoviricetes sp.]